MHQDAAALVGKHVAFLSWRDTGNPEAGGAERYLESMARGLVKRGCKVTIFSAHYEGAPAHELRDGIQFVHRGSKLSVYLRGMESLLRRRFGRVDLVVDVQNGLPFFSPLATRRPVVVMVFHVHREQWPIVYPGMMGKVGWWIESKVAPRLYARRQYLTISRATMSELVGLGVDAHRIAIAHTGTDPMLDTGVAKTADPSLCVVGRLVPHKQVEQAIDAAVTLRAEFPGLRLHVVGDGWWEDELHAYARRVGAGDTVVFEGRVSEERKNSIYQSSWLQLLPSVKEGWGLVIGEAGQHGTPTIAYAAAGGPREAILDGRSGVLVDTFDELLAATRRLLKDSDELSRLAEGARGHSGDFTWDETQSAFAHVMASAMRRELTHSMDTPEV